MEGETTRRAWKFPELCERQRPGNPGPWIPEEGLRPTAAVLFGVPLLLHTGLIMKVDLEQPEKSPDLE